MRHKIILCVTAFVFCIALGYLALANLILKTSIDKREVKFQKQLESEKEKIMKDLEEKYRADIVSYRAMAKRLEIEKKKTKEMQQSIEDLKDREGKN